MKSIHARQKKELFAREGYYIRTIKCINTTVMGRSEIERNKETINCDCGYKYIRQHKSRHVKTKRHLKYVNECGDVTLKEKLMEREKYISDLKQHKNKIALCETDEKYIICKCGSVYTKRGKKRHVMTIKHKDYINNN